MGLGSVGQRKDFVDWNTQSMGADVAKQDLERPQTLFSREQQAAITK